MADHSQEIGSDLPLRSVPIEYNRQLLNSQIDNDEVPPTMDPIVYDSSLSLPSTRVDMSDFPRDGTEIELPTLDPSITKGREDSRVIQNPVEPQINQSGSTMSTIPISGNPVLASNNDNTTDFPIDQIIQAIGNENVDPNSLVMTINLEGDNEGENKPNERKPCAGIHRLVYILSLVEYFFWVLAFVFNMTFIVTSFDFSEFSEVLDKEFFLTTQLYAVLIGIVIGPGLATMKFTRVGTQYCCCTKRQERLKKNKKNKPCCCCYVGVICIFQIVGLVFMVISGGISRGKIFQHPKLGHWIVWVLDSLWLSLLIIVFLFTFLLSIEGLFVNRRRRRRRTRHNLFRSRRRRRVSSSEEESESGQVESTTSQDV